MDLKKLLEETKDEKVDSKPVISFKREDDAIAAKFVGVRSGIKTKKSEDAMAIDVEVLEGNVKDDEGNLARGDCTIWASTHLNQIFSQPSLKPGTVFVLRLASVNGKSGFKKFYFKVAEEPDASATDNKDGDEIPY